ncbi:hypothetical protein FBU30_007978 [Linnemannia zychae]|nr:hypothetical protein FBU30_007978 [Linnemannia zychae]
MNAIPQLFSLNLAKPWSSTAPVWEQHSLGPAKALSPGAFSADEKTMVVFRTSKTGSPFAAWQYSVSTDSWTPSNASFPYQNRTGLASVTDPETGLVYTASGYVDPTDGVFLDMKMVQELLSLVEGLKDNTTAGDIYILNTISGVWTQGTSGSPRIYTTCTVAGDQFLVWGGATTNNTMPSADVMIYSISRDEWITSYTPPAAYLDPSVTSGTGLKPSSSALPGSGDDSNKDKSNTGGIVGGVVGGLAVVSQRASREKGHRKQRRCRIVAGSASRTTKRQEALQQQVDYLHIQQQQASTSSPPCGALYNYQPPTVTYPAPDNPIIFEPAPPKTLRDPTPPFPESEWTTSLSNPVVYDPTTNSSTSTPLVSGTRTLKDLEMLSEELAQQGYDVAPRSGHPHAPLTFKQPGNPHTSLGIDPGPIPVTGAASARSISRFYVIGGLPSTANDTLPLAQFFSLDLTQPWDSVAPAWTKLSTVNAPKQRRFPATFSKNQKSLIVFRAGEPAYIRRYIIASGNWSPSTVNLTQFGSREGVGAVTDPNTGLVYIARGYTDPLERSVDVYNVDRDVLTEVPLPPATSFLAQRTYYGNVWCQPRRSILYFGGYALETQPAPISPVITEFIPSNQTWSTMTTFGEPPSLRADHCMTISEDGTRMVVYGGSPSDKSAMSGDVFMFNTLTKTWSKGNSGPPRAYATCTIAGDILLIWGGTAPDNTVASGEVLLYNMANDTWVQKYNPAPATASPSLDPSSPETDASNKNVRDAKSVNIGAIVGGAIGGAVVIATIGFILFRRKSQQRQDKMLEKSTPAQNDSNIHDDDDGPLGKTQTAGITLDKSLSAEKEEIRYLREQLKAHKEQQEDLQKQVELLKNQYIPAGSSTGAVSQEIQYGYHPPTYYSSSTNAVASQLGVIQPSPTGQNSVVYMTSPSQVPVTLAEPSSESHDFVGSSSNCVPGVIVRSPEGLIQGTIPHQNYSATEALNNRPNNPHTPVVYSSGPHAIIR